jgi:transglutaminase/protease-like cytokinesis protein 3
VKTYYVSTEKEYALAINLIKFNMETDVKIIYSKDMIPKSKNSIRSHYIDMIIFSSDLYQNSLLSYANDIGVYDRFYIKSLKYNKERDTVTANYTFSYFETTDQSQNIEDQINEAIKDNISRLDTDYAKAKWAYEWVIDNVTYDFTIKNKSIYGGFNGKGMLCSGYTTLYTAIATRLGLDCRYIEGSVNNANYPNHAWNIIKINGIWYCVDTTWGDYHGKDNYFLKSKETLALLDYGFHTSKAYNNYIDNGELFPDTDYVDNQDSEIHYILPSVYNIEMSLFKNNILNINESYLFMINNPYNISIYFISSNEEVATINNDGVVIGKNRGTALITAYNYDLGFEQVCEITVR